MADAAVAGPRVMTLYRSSPLIPAQTAKNRGPKKGHSVDITLLINLKHSLSTHCMSQLLGTSLLYEGLGHSHWPQRLSKILTSSDMNVFFY